jgi:hypothetical protein
MLLLCYCCFSLLQLLVKVLSRYEFNVLQQQCFDECYHACCYSSCSNNSVLLYAMLCYVLHYYNSQQDNMTTLGDQISSLMQGLGAGESP